MSSPSRIAVLASGRGSNLQAILDAIAAGTLDAEVVAVLSDKPDASALHKVAPGQRWARSPKEFADRAAFDAALGDALAAFAPDWVVCAGYMRILGEAFVQRFAGRLVNIHPSLLPLYKGLHTHARAGGRRCRSRGQRALRGAQVDAGTVLAQARVPVLPGDSVEQLAQRVLAVEHPLLIASLQWLVAGRVAERDGQLVVDGHPCSVPCA